MRTLRLLCACTALLAMLIVDPRAWGPAAPADGEIVTSMTGSVAADLGAASSEHTLVSRAAMETLQKGGNAVDAMIAAAFAMTVVKNGANGLGGYGGAMVIYRRDLPEPVVVDFNTRAPLAAKTDMFYKDRKAAESGILSISTWNTVAGLAVALERYGTMKWSDVIQPAVRYAEEGFRLTPGFARGLRSPDLLKWAGSKATYTKPDGTFYEPGDLFVQKDLAGSLRTLQQEGPDAIYTGALAKKMVDYLRSEGGIMAMEDFANWRERHVRVLRPAHTNYRGYDLYTSPIATGGENLIEILNVLKGFDLPKMGFSADGVHHVIEAYKLAWADRLWYVGDPWRAKVPYTGLMSDEYAATRRTLIDPEVAFPYARPGDPWKFDRGGIESYLTKPSDVRNAPARPWQPPILLARDIPPMAPEGDTATTSTMDGNGNMVALTMTVRSNLGSGVTVPGTGISLNNGMGLFHPLEFDPEPVPDHPNRLEGGKIVLNNMNAFVILKDKQPLMTGGGAGGRRIQTECLELIINVLDWKMDVREAVSAPRYHVEQKEPVAVEEAFPYGIAKELEKRGHRLNAERRWGSVHAILRDLATGKMHASGEPRSETAAAGGIVRRGAATATTAR
ncbi:MAG: gamma-glutamyltransferase family protein [Acidobacteria bacterium]|nr:gamma-glutamyltransferase family protein [Acidobacteriota bacterium]